MASTAIFELNDSAEGELYTGREFIDNADPFLIEKIHQEGRHPSGLTYTPNQCFILKNGSNSALAKFDGPTNDFQKIYSKTAFHISPRNAEQTMALHLLLDTDIPLVTITGHAGTGKTLLALAAALELRTDYHQILLARPTIPMRDIGFLPGDVKDKIDPYMMPLHDNLRVIKRAAGDGGKTAQMIGRMLEKEKMVIEPLAFIRGRSLNKVFFIIDEAQNLDEHEIKTIVSRAGENTKLVFTGDVDQIDHPKLDKGRNGLAHIVNRLKGEKLYAHIHLLKSERSPLADLAARKL